MNHRLHTGAVQALTWSKRGHSFKGTPHAYVWVRPQLAAPRVMGLLIWGVTWCLKLCTSETKGGTCQLWCCKTSARQVVPSNGWT